MNAILSLVSLIGSGALLSLSADSEAFRSAAEVRVRQLFMLLADAEIATFYVEVLTRDDRDLPNACRTLAESKGYPARRLNLGWSLNDQLVRCAVLVKDNCEGVCLSNVRQLLPYPFDKHFEKDRQIVLTLWRRGDKYFFC